jgi:tetratricopeptide (TPR) repeat protein
VIVAPRYTDARAFAHGLAAVCVGKDKWRFINTRGEFAFDATFFSVGSFSAAGLAPARKARKDKTGYINTQGEWAIAPQFDIVPNYTDALAFGDAGVAPVSIDGDKFGLIDTRGEWVLKPTYGRIRNFNAEGLAYFSEADSWNDGNGYMNARGEAVIKGERHLSESMTCGVVSSYYNGSTYLRSNGKSLTDTRFSWGSHFNALGFAVVRTPEDEGADAAVRTMTGGTRWAVLRNDATVLPVPSELLEPATDSDGWLRYANHQSPFAEFMTHDGHIAYVDEHAKIAYRLRFESSINGAADTRSAALYGNGGTCLWRSEAGIRWVTQTPFFYAPIESHLDALESIDDVVPFARTLIEHTESRLHQFASDETLDVPVTDDDNDDDDSENELEHASHDITVTRRIIRAYVGEEHNGYYDFLSGVQSRVVDAAHATIREKLIATFGEFDPDPESVALQKVYGSSMRAWPIRLTKPIVNHATLAETNQLWMGLYEQSDSGDGDWWDELWLCCSPSIDALHAALKLRGATVADEGESDNSESDDSSDEEKRPETCDEWMHAVHESKYAIGEVPASLIGEALIDAALVADTGALEYVPAQWHTAARIESLVRKNVETATSIPPRCMTAEALTLARAMYADDENWQYRDDRHSKRPTEWTKNCLYGVWGAVLNEADCVLAVKGGESLQYVPHWLRSEKVERAALDADMYNVSYIDPQKITPELAARAVQHDYGSLIEVIPESLLTLALCLESARVNGLSLEHIPERFRSIDVCVAAMDDDARAFPHVPKDVETETCTRLIELAQANAKRDKEEAGEATRWHSYRAWSRLWHEDFEGAIADATLAIEYLTNPIHPHYVRAWAYRETGRVREASLEASTVLAISDPYQSEFNDEEDTSWLNQIAQGALDASDDAALIEELRAHPLALARVPRERLTSTLIDVAVAADPEAVQFVPKRLMTPALYATAIRTRNKRFSNVPSAMLNEAVCIEEVRDEGRALARVPEQWRTVAVCAYALRDNERAIEFVPEALRNDAKKAMRALPVESDDDDDDNHGDDSSSRSQKDGTVGRWLSNKVTEQLLSSNSQSSPFKKWSSKLWFITWIAQAVFTGKSKEPTKHSGLLGWLEARPFQAVMINAVFAMIALVCHTFLTVEVWRAKGVWIGLATAIFMGLAEVYWAWRFFFAEPARVGLGIVALVVVLYVFVYRMIHRKVAAAIAETSKERE